MSAIGTTVFVLLLPTQSESWRDVITLGLFIRIESYEAAVSEQANGYRHAHDATLYVTLMTIDNLIGLLLLV